MRGLCPESFTLFLFAQMLPCLVKMLFFSIKSHCILLNSIFLLFFLLRLNTVYFPPLYSLYLPGGDLQTSVASLYPLEACLHLITIHGWESFRRREGQTCTNRPSVDRHLSQHGPVGPVYKLYVSFHIPTNVIMSSTKLEKMHLILSSKYFI